jgi:GNAT superfamily N-acetyltransferase
MKLQFESLNSACDYSEFDCGHEALNQFLVKRAKTEEAQRLSRTKIAINESHEVVGFYTIAPATIGKIYLEASEGRGVSYSEIPALRIGRLAVNKRHQRLGLGQVILKHALLRCLKLSNQMGGRVVLVDAKDDHATSFYKKFGFKGIKENPLILVLKISTLEKAFYNSSIT